MSTIIIILITLSLIGIPVTLIAVGKIKINKWDDKDWHRLACTSILFLTSFTLFYFLGRHWALSIVIGAFLAWGIGYGREKYQAKKNNVPFNKEDMAANYQGILVGAMIAFMTFMAILQNQ